MASYAGMNPAILEPVLAIVGADKFSLGTFFGARVDETDIRPPNFPESRAVDLKSNLSKSSKLVL